MTKKIDGHETMILIFKIINLMSDKLLIETPVKAGVVLWRLGDNVSSRTMGSRARKR